MKPGRILLRDKVLHNLAARGEEGAAWAAGLRGLVEDLERRWNLEVDEPYPTATEAFAAPAMTAGGVPVVLKITIPGIEKAQREAQILTAAAGRGYVRLLDRDPASGALLLERLGPQLAQSDLADEARMGAICDTLREAWMPVPAGLAVPTGAEKARGMADYIREIWRKLDHPVSEHAINVALRFAQARRAAFDPKTAVLGHGDAHVWNTLSDPKTGRHKFVDPDGWFIEKAHDLSISLREASAVELLAGDAVALGHKRCRFLAEHGGAPFEAIWQWGYIERLVNGLIYLDVGPADAAPQFIDVAEAWARAESR